MKRAIPALLAVLALGVGIAVGQVVTNPDIARAIACVYNLTPVTLTSGQVGWTQCDNAGSMKVTGTFTPSGSSPEFTPVAPATATATNGVLLGGQYDSTQKTLTNGQQAAYSASPRGALFVAPGAENFAVNGPVATGAAAAGAGNPLYIAGIDDSNNVRPLRTNTSGNLYASIAGITQGGTAFTGSGFGTVVMGTDGTNGQVLLMDSNKNLLVSAGGAPALATAQASITTGNIQAAAARTGRRSITITNVTGTGPAFCGNTGVTTSTGTYLAGTAGSSITLNTTAAVFCTVAATTQTVSVAETY